MIFDDSLESAASDDSISSRMAFSLLPSVMMMATICGIVLLRPVASQGNDEENVDPCKNNPCQNGICLTGGER